MNIATAYAPDFQVLFRGRTDCYGRGEGRVVKAPITVGDYEDHLAGLGSGLGVFPLRQDGTVFFAAVDLDFPDFNLAGAVAGLLPGEAWVESSRSGNAHVWSFFTDPLEAWVARGVMRSALEALGELHVEVFPKQDTLREGSYGNYINLPCHGTRRPILYAHRIAVGERMPMPVTDFIVRAIRTRSRPDTWRSRARALGIQEPDADRSTAAFGERNTLHECAAYIIQGARSGERPLVEGHRSVVLFNLAKMLLNYRGMSTGEAQQLLDEVNQATDPPLPQDELNRFLVNAATKRYTSTGCDDPVMAPYVHPDCPIAHG